MEQLGTGVIIRKLRGNEDTARVLHESAGQTIASLTLKPAVVRDDVAALIFRFTDGTAMQLRDEGQQCCEVRYMHTDDRLSDFVGAQFRSAKIRSVPLISTDEYDGKHEIQFLIVKTSIGEFTIETHNVHNGYYGGFSVEASVVEETS